MNPQQKEFDVALANLTPQERATYIKANPTISVGGIQQSVNNGSYQPITKTITTEDINTNANLIPIAEKAPIAQYNPIVTAPTGTTINADGIATYIPPVQKIASVSKEKSLYQKALDAISFDINKLENKPEETKKLQEEQQLALKTEQATKDYNAYTFKKREFEKKIQELQVQTGGKTTAGVNDEISVYTRRANAELADLAIQAQASQGLLDSARQTIKDTIEAQFSPIEDRIARRSQYAQLVANDLTESEKYRLDQLNKKDEANQKEVSTYATNLANTVFENGAPVGVRTKIFNIAGDYATGKITKEQAQAKMMEAAGNYGVNLTDKAYKQAQTEKLISEISKLDKEGTVGTFDLSTPQGRIVSAAQNLASKYSSKFAQEQFLANVKRLSASGDVQQLSDYVFSEAISNIADTETRKKAFGNYRVVKQLNNLEQQLENYYSLGGDTNIFVGTKENMLAKIGTVQNTELRKIATSISNTLDELARARTGAVINEEEQKLYQSILPGTKKTANLNRSIISGLNNSLSSDIDSILKFQLSGSGFESIKDYQSLTGNNGQNQPSSKTQQPEIDRSNVEINGLQVRLPSGEFWNAPTLEALNKFKIKYGL